MSLAILFALLALQAPEPRLPITIRCELDTELPMDPIRVSLEEKRELNEKPKRLPEGGGRVTLADLPSGDLHLLFFQGSKLLGKVEIPSAEEGEFIRVVVRLVEDNAILLDDFRVRGVSEMAAEAEDPDESREEPIPPSIATYPPPSPPSPAKVPSDSFCPEPGEPMTLRGKLVRIIDNDSFELESGPWSYTIYAGTATRIHAGRTPLTFSAIAQYEQITVKGRVAAGPADECSIGATDIEVRR